MERKLASIQKILAVDPIPNADSIEVATVLGWKAVIRKGSFKPGDLCVYCEVDSVLPELPEYDFLKDRHYRVKTIKLRGQVSQGLILPLTVSAAVPEGGLLPLNDQGAFPGVVDEVGKDVTELLGIKKYEPPVSVDLSGENKGGFPAFLFKTDEERIQSVPELISDAKNESFYVTEKLDGTSSTFYLKDGIFGVCSRNMEKAETDKNLYWRVARSLRIADKLSKAEGNIAIQGEIVGPGIRKNKYDLGEPMLFVYSVYDIDGAKYFSYTDMVSFCKTLGFSVVPVIDVGISLKGQTVDSLVEKSKGQSRLNPASMREGIVVRTMEEKYHPSVGRFSFKVINAEFLLKHDE